MPQKKSVTWEMPLKANPLMPSLKKQISHSSIHSSLTIFVKHPPSIRHYAIVKTIVARIIRKQEWRGHNHWHSFLCLSGCSSEMLIWLFAFNKFSLFPLQPWGLLGEDARALLEHRLWNIMPWVHLLFIHLLIPHTFKQNKTKPRELASWVRHESRT